MEKYYWVKWKIKSHNWYEDGRQSHHEFEADELIEQHPLAELIERRGKYGKEQQADDNPRRRVREDYDIVNWKELTEQEFNKFDGYI